jgi:hypothetical protein
MAGKRSPTSHRTPAQIRQHYKDYQGTPEQIKKRAMRNAARAAMEKKHGAAALKGKDVDHKKMLDHGGTNDPKNLRIQSVKENRGWERKRR